MVSALFYGSIFCLVIMLVSRYARLRHIARMQEEYMCLHCGGHYTRMKDPRGQLCPHCGKSVVTYVPSQQVDTDRYSYRTPGQIEMQTWNTCGCIGVPKEARSALYPSMWLCADCIQDEAVFTKPPQK